MGECQRAPDTMMSDLLLTRHDIVLVNIDRQQGALLRLHQAVVDENIVAPTIICIQQFTKPVDGLEQLVALFGHLYDYMISPSLEDRQLGHQFVMLNLRTRCTIERLLLMAADDKYKSSPATAAGVEVLLHSNQDTTATVCRNEATEDGRRFMIFSANVRSSADEGADEDDDKDMAMMLEWIKTTANAHVGLKKSIIIGDLNATNRLWELQPVGISANRAQGSEEHLKVRINRGRQLFNFIRSNKLHCLNKVQRERTINTTCVDLILLGRRLIKRVEPCDSLAAIKLFESERRLEAIACTYTLVVTTADSEQQLVASQMTVSSSANMTTNKRKREIDSDPRSMKRVSLVKAENGAKLTATDDQRDGDNIGQACPGKDLQQSNETSKERNKDLIRPEMFSIFRRTAAKLMRYWYKKSRDEQMELLNSLVYLIYSTILEVQAQITRFSVDLDRERNKPPLPTITFIPHLNFYLNFMKRARNSKQRQIQRTRERLVEYRCELRDAMMSSEVNAVARRGMDKLSKLLQAAKIEIQRLRVTIGKINKGMIMATTGTAIRKRMLSIKRQLSEGNLLHHEDLWRRLKPTEPNWSKKCSLQSAVGSVENDDDLEHIAQNLFPSDIQNSGAYEMLYEVINTVDCGDRKCETSIEEFDLALGMIKDSTALSPEKIYMDVFYACAREHMREYVRLAAYMSLCLCHIPEQLRETRGTLVAKKAREFRIIHTHSPITVVIAIMVGHRLEHEMDELKLANEEDFGLSARKDRHDLICIMIHTAVVDQWRSVLNCKPMNHKITTIVKLSIDNASDNVCHEDIVKKLGDSPCIKRANMEFWLCKFILDRTITLHYGDLTSSPRTISRGLPRGLNFTTALLHLVLREVTLSDFETQVSNIQLLKYNDEMFIVQKGFASEELQLAIDSVVDQLAKINLKLDPAKCCCLPIAYGKVDSSRLNHATYKIATTTSAEGGCCIKRQNLIKVVDQLNFFGLSLKNNLKLDRRLVSTKILAATRDLRHIKRAGIITEADNWRILIDEHLLSKSVSDNWPLLMLSVADREWLDSQLAEAIKLIFDWPSRITTAKSNKLVRFILDLKPVGLMVEQRAKLKFASLGNHRTATAVSGLLRALNQSNTTKRSGLINSERLEHETISDWHRVADPRYTMAKPNKLLSSLDEVHLTEHGNLWFVFCTEKAAMAAETHGHKIEDVRLIVNDQYSSAFANQLTLLWHLAYDDYAANRNLVLRVDDKLLASLKDFSNRDGRISLLRERLMRSGWNIYTISKANYGMVELNLARLLNVSVIRHVKSIGNLRNLMDVPRDQRNVLANVLDHRREVHRSGCPYDGEAMNPKLLSTLLQSIGFTVITESDDHGEKFSANADEQLVSEYPRLFSNIEQCWMDHEVLCEHVEQPILRDLHDKNAVKQEIRAESRAIMMANMPEICYAIAGCKLDLWQGLSPSYLDAYDVLTLGDLYRHGTSGKIIEYPGADRSCEVCLQDLRRDKHGKMILRLGHIVLHRLMECPGYREMKRQMHSLITAIPESKLVDERSRRIQRRIRFVKILTGCAFNPPSCQVKSVTTDE